MKMHYSNIRDSSSVKSPSTPHFMNEKTEVPKKKAFWPRRDKRRANLYFRNPLVKPGKTHPQFTGKEIEASDWPLVRSSAIQ